MKYCITYLTVKPSTGHNKYNVGYWLNKDSIPKEYIATRTVEYNGKLYDEGWCKLVTEDVVDIEVIYSDNKGHHLEI